MFLLPHKRSIHHFWHPILFISTAATQYTELIHENWIKNNSSICRESEWEKKKIIDHSIENEATPNAIHTAKHKTWGNYIQISFT